ncbi:imidazole glycerol phosphate synthase subunit HisH [Chloroflexus sp. Y-396-1]|uniref:imidazole glycerol phosphate synthase subunit HisH n=1 Tax=Chloroflexus sp. Y-396-1 TaxID=867845 RepID=UPI00048ECC6B|nr:imidazole glycerol phosphate synthase subunit HisH [Chloroflexus sp. Y-396-1]
MIAVINYGAGNLPNVVRALQRVGASLTVTDDPNVIHSAQAVVLPGVGATADTMASLRHLGIAEVLPAIIAAGTPFLGICVGMQVLLSESEEFGLHSCLNIIQGTVRRLPESAGKIPQIGWNQIHITPPFRDHPLFDGIPNGADVYFVHSYYCAVADESVVAARTDYGLAFPSVIIRNRLAAVQFHPEKSGDYGLRLLANFVRWSGASDSVGAS